MSKQQQFPPELAPSIVVETVLVALLERKKVLIYSKPGFSTTALLQGIEAGFPKESRGAHFHKPALRSQGATPPPDLNEIDALLVNDVSLPAFEQHRDHMSGDMLGVVAGLSGMLNRDKALNHWALFFDGAPDLIIEIAMIGLFYDVTDRAWG